MSVRSDYKVEELRKQIAVKRDTRIANAKEKFAYESDTAARRDEWRKEAEAAVRSLHRRLKTMSDTELQGFRVKRAPSYNEYRTPEDERDREIREAQASFERAMRRLDAISSDAGIVSLTPSMLTDVFGL